MSSAGLDAIDPFLEILKILKLLRTDPTNSTQLAASTIAIKQMFVLGRTLVESIEDSDLSTKDQAEVIAILEDRVQRKQYGD